MIPTSDLVTRNNDGSYSPTRTPGVPEPRRFHYLGGSNWLDIARGSATPGLLDRPQRAVNPYVDRQTRRLPATGGWTTNVSQRAVQTPEEIDDYMRTNYGYLAAFVDQPEVGGVLREAAMNRWSTGRLQGALYNTNWWQTTDAANRTWQQLTSEDPAEARRLVAQQAESIATQVRAWGLEWSSSQIADLAYLAEKNGWTDEQTMRKLLQQTEWTRQKVTNVSRSVYGDLAAFIDQPEVYNILQAAVLDQWDPGRVYEAVQNTSWWRNSSESQRQWSVLQNSDPAQARAMIQQQVAALRDQTRTWGIQMSEQELMNLAQQTLSNGWSDAQTIDKILAQINWEQLKAGELTAMRDDVFALAGDYLTGMSEETARAYALAIASGEMSGAGVESAMREAAKQRFSYLAEEIDQGVTPSLYFANSRDVLAAELEMSPETIDLMDTDWFSRLETVGEDGKRRAATLTEVRQNARQTEQWQNTDNAKRTTTQLIKVLADAFGRSTF